MVYKPLKHESDAIILHGRNIAKEVAIDGCE